MSQQSRKAFWLLSIAFVLGSTMPATPVEALETDILLAGNAVKPNVLLLFDNSGSMNDNAAYIPTSTYSGPYAPNTVYSRCRTYRNDCTCRRVQRSWVADNTCGFVDNDGDGVDDRTSYKEIGNRLNYEQGAPNKIQVAKSVINGLLKDPANANVRFGMMVYNGNWDINSHSFSDPSNFTNYHNDTSVLKSAIQDNNQQNLIATINGLTANGGTPSANRLIQAGNYFAGTFPGQASPIQYPCQRNYIVDITDGVPEGEGNSLTAHRSGDYPDIENWLHVKLGSNIDPDGDGSDPAICSCYINGGSDYLDDVAWVMQNQDLLTSMDGIQNVTTFTIGFDVDNPLLLDTAKNGGGKYFTATTADQLADALRRTLNLIITDAQSFVAPVVPVNALKRTQSGDRLYIALFQPLQQSTFWGGNIKKYAINQSGDLSSPNGSPATAADGSLLSTASSFFDTSPSGGSVTRGGVGEILLNRTTPRNIYTYLGNVDLSASSNVFSVSNTSLTSSLLAVPDSQTRDNVINYVRGQDVYDDDEDGNTTEARAWILGDFVHSTPLVVDYGTGNKAIIAGANDGQLHAFDDETGEELWAFIPPAVLPRLKELTPGGAPSHPFLVDGSPKLLATDSGEKIVIFGLRRGGAYYYALDITSEASPKYLWGIGASTSGMSELGQTWSEPAVGKMGSSSSFNYVAIFGAGYDTYYDSPSDTGPDTTSPVGRGVFVVNAFTGAILQSLRPGGMTFPVPSNLSALDVNGDGTLDIAYFGDLGGNLWRLDLPSTLTKVFSSPSGHKIFAAPDLVRDQGYLDVFFGTGDLANPLETSVTDRLYLFRDDGLTGGYTENNLVDVTDNLVQEGSASQQQLLRSQLASSKGWFIRLTNPGEKSLSSPLAFFDVFFTTFLPTSDVCSGGGDARLYILGFDDGSATADLDANGSLSSADRSEHIGSSIPTEVTPTIRESDAMGYVGVGGAIPKIQLPGPPLNVIPIYWRELF